MTSPDPDLKIPGYRIIRELGRGGMARVYLAVQESMEREVAIKVMLPALAASDPSFSERFLREARIVAKLSHPHIIAVIDVGVAGPYHYYSMEYHTGGDLKARIHEGMMPKMALSLTRQITSALAFAHSKGYVHRDVKPENVIFRQDGTALLTDFGIAKAGDGATRMTATGAIIGTPHYMSPEQAQGAELDHRSDLYSLGVMLYEMLTGSVPYNGTSALSIGIKHLKDPIPQLPPPLQIYQPLLERFMAKNPSDRFSSGEEAMAAIDAMTSGTHSTLAGTAMPTRITGDGLATPAAAEPTRVSGTLARTQVSGNYAATQVTGAPGAAGGRRGLYLGLAALLPVIAVAAYFVLRSPSPGAASTVSATAASAPAPAADDQSGRIAQLLAEGNAAATAGRYLEPRDQGAVAKYRQVLNLDAGNEHAARGLQEIARHYIAQTDRALERKSLDDATAALNQAEETDPANPLLAARRQALQEARANNGSAGAAPEPERKAVARAASTRRPEPAARAAARATPAPVTAPAAKLQVAAAAPRISAAQEQEQRLATNIVRIKELIAPGKLTATRAGLAAEVFTESAKLAPSDPRVLNASNQIAEAYLKLATERADDKDYREAESLVRKGLNLVPNHRLLAGLQKDIVERQKAKRQTFGGF